MNSGWSILYRGPLSSCNYDCGYCPFAKRQNTREEIQEDRRCLERFAGWVESRSERISVLFTPWGEALGHRYYQQTLIRLSHREQVQRVAIQTNLSASLEWVADANRCTLALWCTFHPTQTSLDRFVAQCQALDAQGVRYSVGMVGVREAFGLLRPLRAALRPEIYVWVNAFKSRPDYYSGDEIDFLTRIDPLFPVNNQHHESRGRECRTGHTVFSVNGAGEMRRCHFVDRVIGNIYEPGFEAALRPRVCTAATCGCHIGYVHLEHLRMNEVFGDGLLERIPKPQTVAHCGPLSPSLG